MIVGIVTFLFLVLLLLWLRNKISDVAWSGSAALLLGVNVGSRIITHNGPTWLTVFAVSAFGVWAVAFGVDLETSAHVKAVRADQWLHDTIREHEGERGRHDDAG